jgi:uncharacterized protein
MANRLATQTSPYLLQHKDNPVDWYPWGEEALARARAEDRPVLVSIGYSACHWCHVMEHESFEDPETASFMNDRFVSIKVDREERPDVDAIYMQAVQAMTGHGGWPLNVFVDPEGVPFFGGTYFPPAGRQGMPSWRQVLEGVAEAWDSKRDEIRAAAPRTVEQLAAVSEVRAPEDELSPEVLDEAERTLATLFDSTYGGFGGAPKFPPASALEFLMMRDSDTARRIVTTTLERMAKGGMYDQVGGGFARYSVDAQWLVPHFEKMLYDNALLARAYLHAWQLTGDAYFRRICEETLDWALREMRGPEGGFYSALDADSEGEEGRFYVWTPEEIREILAGTGTDDANCINFSTQQIEKLMQFYGVSEGGNFEGRDILHLAESVDADQPEALDEMRRALYEARAKRVWPGLDDKRLASWNALTIAALAEAGAVLEREDYLEAARACADFLWDEMRDSDGNLLRTYKDGRAHLNAYLEDHAYLFETLLTLYEATFEQQWFERAVVVAETLIARFGDPDRGGFFSTSSDHESLIARRKEIGDHPIPSGNSSAAMGLLRLSALTGNRSYEQQAESIFRLFAKPATQHPESFAHLLRAIDFHLAPTKEVALIGNDLSELAQVVRAKHRPHLVLAGGSEGASVPPLLQDRTTTEGNPTAYVCEHFTCQAPTTDPKHLNELL